MKVYIVLKHLYSYESYYDMCHDLPSEIISVHLEKRRAELEVKKLEAENDHKVWYEWCEKEISATRFKMRGSYMNNFSTEELVILLSALYRSRRVSSKKEIKCNEAGWDASDVKAHIDQIDDLLIKLINSIRE